VNALQTAILLGRFSRDTSGLASNFMSSPTGLKVAQFMLPTVMAVEALPRVPDGAVVGRPYIPPNTTVDVVTSTASLQKSGVRVSVAAGGLGLVVGLVIGHALTRK
jgi:hypothetical protein